MLSLPKMSYNVPFESAIIVPSKAAGSRDLAAFGFGLCIGTSQGHGPSAHAPSRIWAPPAGCDAGICMPILPARGRNGNAPAGGRWAPITDKEHLSVRCRGFYMSHSYRHPRPDERHAQRERGSRTRVRHQRLRVNPSSLLAVRNMAGIFYAPVAEQADAPASKAVLFLQVRFLSGAPIRGHRPAGTCPQ